MNSRPLKHPVEHPNHNFASGCVLSWTRIQKARITSDYFSSRTLRLPPLLLRVFLLRGNGWRESPVPRQTDWERLSVSVCSEHCYGCLPQQADPRRLPFIILALCKRQLIEFNTTAQRRKKANKHRYSLSGTTAPTLCLQYKSVTK